MKRAFPALFFFIGAIFLPSAAAFAFDQYSLSSTAGNCADCHGNFRGTAPYLSLHDGVAWKNPTTAANLNLHDGHRTYMLNSDCNVCHSGTSRFPVSTFSSNGGTGFQPISCTGCHNGDGLRAHHDASGVTVCWDCHSPATPPAENVLPPYYFTPDAAHPNKPTSSCNVNGSESSVAPPYGLDNDGNLSYDQSDPACAAPAGPSLVTSITPTGGGIIKGTGINCPGTCSGTYAQGDAIQLFAIANIGFQLTGWTGCPGPLGNECSFAITSNQNVGANFSACGTSPVLVGATTYPSIQSALLAAPIGGVIELQAVLFSESPIISATGDTVLSGGLNCNYSGIAGQSVISGVVTLAGGPVTVDDIVIQ